MGTDTTFLLTKVLGSNALILSKAHVCYTDSSKSYEQKNKHKYCSLYDFSVFCS